MSQSSMEGAQVKKKSRDAHAEEELKHVWNV